jgi:outer membrane protein assembly factor BamE (lipoprotein component of BamABCDE complex)
MRYPIRQFLLTAFLAIAMIVVPLPLGAQPSVQVADLLRGITARIHVADVATGKGGLCHGFVSSVRSQVAFVATAKHCIEELTGRPLLQGTSLRELNLSATVEYANGATGTVRYIAWSRNQDALVLVTSFTNRPTSYAGLCSGCRNYRSLGAGQTIRVESVLSAGGGPPVISSGMVLSDSFGRYVVMLPSSPGTSGSPVLDLQGNLVGIVVTGAVYRGAEASWVAGIVPGSTVVDLVRFAVEHFESPPSQAATPTPPSLSPGLPVPPTSTPDLPPTHIPRPPGTPSTTNDQFLITPGKGIGNVRVGMSITDVVASLGRPKVTMPYSKTGSDTLYAWFDYTPSESRAEDRTWTGGILPPPPGCTTPGCWEDAAKSQHADAGGLTVVCAQTGRVTIIQAYYAPQYATVEGLHTGVTEKQVRSALGAPTKVDAVANQYRSLEYISLGISFRVVEDNRSVPGSGTVYGTVYLIKVYSPQP